MTSAASRLAPILTGFSKTRPFFRFFNLSLLKAYPFPGLLNSDSTILKGSPSIKTFNPFLKSPLLYETTAILYLLRLYCQVINFLKWRYRPAPFPSITHIMIKFIGSNNLWFFATINPDRIFLADDYSRH